ncbi:MAG: hypothetical protein Fur005_14390 [Roseiflexaceae bacterium]
MHDLRDLFANRVFQIIAIGLGSLVILLAILGTPDRPLVLSSWAGGGSANAPTSVLGFPPGRTGDPPSGARRVGISSQFFPVATPAAPGSAALSAYTQASTAIDEVGAGAIQYYRRDLPGGSLHFVVVALDGRSEIAVITANGARLTSDATGDTAWADGGKHLAPVASMAQAPYAVRPNATLVAAMAFGFHGARTADEGTVVIDGVIQRINAGRSALCIDRNDRASIGVFDDRKAALCRQAAGAGPIAMWAGKVTNPAVGEESERFLPFNPFGEDFVQDEWRRTVYSGSYPKTFIGIGRHSAGHDYLVFLTSYGVDGVTAVQALREMGCTSAIAGDDDTSTQLVWRGQLISGGEGRPVPTAIGIYLRQ